MNRRPVNVIGLLPCSYGRKSRNVVDVYVPPGSPGDVGPDGKGGTPVALFCHGGVWAVGGRCVHLMVCIALHRVL